MLMSGDGKFRNFGLYFSLYCCCRSGIDRVICFSLCFPCLYNRSSNTAPFFTLRFAGEGSIQSLELLLWKTEKDALAHVLRQIKAKLLFPADLSFSVLCYSFKSPYLQ